MAVVKPFRALRYDTATAGPLEQLVAPPYDVISPEERERYVAASPYNVVRLTLPDSEEQAAHDFAAWQREGVLVAEAGPSFWALEQDYVGPDGIARTRRGLVASLRVEPYESNVVLPHERTHRGPKEGRLRLLRAVRAHLEPIFLLHDAPPTAAPRRDADIETADTRAWRIGAHEGLVDAFAARRLVIADGHHRYETALAFHAEEGTDESAYLMVVLVSTHDDGLTIFPTHRIVERLRDVDGSAPALAVDEALARLEQLPRDRAAVALYERGTARVLEGEEAQLDAALVQTLEPEGVTYTPRVGEAVAAVDSGRARAAFLLRPPTIEQVRGVAERGETMPQKSTYFYPKLVSGLLFHPL
ncbi:MAG: DUF1015 domain-containing protein [Actinomycetota bacterium]|nr:DUF1015 domain-containing protein [Actinomycetota bacterium]